jgi:rhodanese-related sulfurtransferase
MRPRLLVLGLMIVILGLAAAAAGCSTEQAASPAGSGAPAEPAGYATVDVQTAHDALSTDPGAQLLDVREPAEWAETGVPEGAVLIPLGEVDQSAASELDPASPVYVICRSGNRSRTAAEALVRLGFSDVVNVDGGVNAWTAAGLPTEAYQQ